MSRDALLRVRSARGEVIGTGFLLRGLDGRAYAVTCAHVINAAMGRQPGTTAPPPDDVTLDLSTPHPARILSWFPPTPVGRAKPDLPTDIAVLDPGIVSESSWPALRAEPPSQLIAAGDLPFAGRGFMGQEDGLPVRGVLRDVDAGGWFVAHAAEGFGSFIEGGLSGAPVHDREDRILGMVSQRLGPAGSAEGLIIPAALLARAWPHLACPYVGLDSFTARTAHLFFGREKDIGLLLARVATQRELAVIGGSGSGKSSVVQAGLIPRMARDGWHALVFEPKQHPMAQWADAIARTLQPGADPIALAQSAALWRSHLAEGRLDPALDALRGAGTGVLVVIDQFEQFFTADDDRKPVVAEERRAILRMLRDAAKRPDIRVVVTLREDFLSRIKAEEPAAARLLTDPRPPFSLNAMSEDDIRLAIVDAARVFGVDVDPLLATNFSRDAAGGDGRLPLLQLGLGKLWPMIRQEGPTWHLPTPPSGNGLSAILESAGNDAVADLETGRRGDPVPRPAVDRVLRSLVRTDPRDRLLSKRIVTLNFNPRPAERADWQILEHLAEDRLVRIGEANDQPTAELAHDRLIAEWPQLAAVIDRDRAFLEWLSKLRDSKMPFWESSGRSEDQLLAGADIDEAADWVARRRDDIPDEMEAYVAASLARRRRLQADETAKQIQLTAALRSTQRALAVVGMFLVVVLLLAGIAYGRYREALAERNQAFLAQSRILAKTSTEELARDPIRAYLLAAQAVAWPLDVPTDKPATPEARQALLDAAAVLAGRTVPVGQLKLIDYVGGIVPLRLANSPSSGTVDAVTIDPAAATSEVHQVLPSQPLPRFSVWVGSDGERFQLVRRLSDGSLEAANITEAGGLAPWLEVHSGMQWEDSPDLRWALLCEAETTTLVAMDTGAKTPLDGPGCAADRLATTPLGYVLTSEDKLSILVRRLAPDIGPSERIENDDPNRFIGWVTDVASDDTSISVLISYPGGARVWSTDPARRWTLPDGSFHGNGWISQDGGTAILGDGKDASQYWVIPRNGTASRLSWGDGKLDASLLAFNRRADRILIRDASKPNAATVFDREAGRSTPIVRSRGTIGMDADGRYLLSINGADVVVWNIDLLIDLPQLVRVAENEVKGRIARNRDPCLTRAQLATFGLVEPEGQDPRQDGPHACPLATDFPHRSNDPFAAFFQGLFRFFSGRSI